jgi:hypothetical protein
MASLSSIPVASRGAAGRFQLAALVPHATASAMDVRDGQDPTPVGQCRKEWAAKLLYCTKRRHGDARVRTKLPRTTFFGEERARGHGVPRTKPIVFFPCWRRSELAGHKLSRKRTAERCRRHTTCGRGRGSGNSDLRRQNEWLLQSTSEGEDEPRRSGHAGHAGQRPRAETESRRL